MNAVTTLIVFVPVALAGAAPFIAVHRGGKAFDADDDDGDDEPLPEARPTNIDDTTQIPLITNDSYNY